MISLSLPLPASLFITPSGADWLKADRHPAAPCDGVDLQQFAREFLHRNTRYEDSFEALQTGLQATKDSMDREEAVDRFCLLWQIGDALRIAWFRRRPQAGVIVHSDRGSQGYPQRVETLNRVAGAADDAKPAKRPMKLPYGNERVNGAANQRTRGGKQRSVRVSRTGRVR